MLHLITCESARRLVHVIMYLLIVAYLPALSVFAKIINKMVGKSSLSLSLSQQQGEKIHNWVQK